MIKHTECRCREKPLIRDSQYSIFASGHFNDKGACIKSIKLDGCPTLCLSKFPFDRIPSSIVTHNRASASNSNFAITFYCWNSMLRAFQRFVCMLCVCVCVCVFIFINNSKYFNKEFAFILSQIMFIEWENMMCNRKEIVNVVEAFHMWFFSVVEWKKMTINSLHVDNDWNGYFWPRKSII